MMAKDESLAEPISRKAIREEYNNYGSGPQISYVQNAFFIGVETDPSTLINPYGQAICTYNELADLSRNHFHLFVLEREYYGKGVFSVSKSVALKYTDEDDWNNYFRLGERERCEVLNMPAILATKNHRQGKADDRQFFYLAKLDRISDQGGTFSIDFRTDGFGHRQQILNEHCAEFGLHWSSMLTEMDELHWAIKKGDLLGRLADSEQE